MNYFHKRKKYRSRNGYASNFGDRFFYVSKFKCRDEKFKEIKNRHKG